MAHVSKRGRSRVSPSSAEELLSESDPKPSAADLDLGGRRRGPKLHLLAEGGRRTRITHDYRRDWDIGNTGDTPNPRSMRDRFAEGLLTRTSFASRQGFTVCTRVGSLAPVQRIRSRLAVQRVVSFIPIEEVIPVGSMKVVVVFSSEQRVVA